MPGVTGEVHLKGIRELQRDLNKCNRDAGKVVLDALKEAGEPVRRGAETLASRNISHIGRQWGRMKLGTRTGSVFIAPRSRRRRGSPRPNLGILLLEKAMFPAVEAHERELVREVEDALERMTIHNGLGRMGGH